MSTNNDYDEIPYPSYTFPQTNPDRLATLATLHNLSPALPSGCRYLELGCGNGTNVAYSASLFPNSEFFGIDLSNRHIAYARETADVLGLSNASFESGDILDLDPGKLGKFDFIVAHGLFSWVPDNVRERVLAIMAGSLSENGVGYISYNTYPGCYLREVGWDLAKLRTASIGGFRDKIESAASVFETLGSLAESGSLPARLYRQLHADAIGKRPETVLHDDLAEINKPFYFLEFAAMVKDAGLKYVCESELLPYGNSNPTSETADAVAKLSDDPLERIQYADFVEFTRFRMSLVCRENWDLSLESTHEAIGRLYATTELRLLSDTSAIADEKAAKFATPDGRTITINHPLTKSILANLRPHAASSLSEFLKDEIEAEQAERFILQLHRAGLVGLHSAPLACSPEAGEMPEEHKFARWQAAAGCDSMTSIFGVNIAFDNDLIRAMVALLDGTRDRATLAADLVRELKLSEEEVAEAAEQLPGVIESNLERLAELGLLTG